MLRTFALALAVVLAHVTATGVRAQSHETARLVYERGPHADSCPDEQTLRDAVAARIGRDPFVADAPRSVHVSLESANRELSATIQFEEQGTIGAASVLHGSLGHCEALLGAVALAITVVLEPMRPPPSAVVAPPPPTSVAPVPVQPIAVSPVDPHTAPAIPRRSDTPLLLQVGLGLAAVIGPEPNASGGLVLFLGLRVKWLSIGIEGRADLPTGFTDRSGGSVSEGLYAGSLAACAHISVVGICALGTLGALAGSRGPSASMQQQATLFGGIGLRALAELSLTEVFALRAFIDVEATVARTAVSVDGSTLWTTPPVIGALGLAAVASFH